MTISEVISRHVSELSAREGRLTAIDFGCGSSPYQSLFPPNVTDYVRVDLPSNDAADVVIDDERGCVPLPSESADIVISNQVLEHVDSPGQYLTEARRLCRHGGILILSTHGFWMYHPDPQDYWRWTGSGLRKLLQDTGWEVVEFRGIMGFAAASAALLQDAVSPKIPRPLRLIFTVVMQQIVRFLDRLYSHQSRRENACIYLVVARKQGT